VSTFYQCYMQPSLSCLLWAYCTPGSLNFNVDMKYLVLLLWSGHVVDTELFIRSNNHMLDQLIYDKPSRSSRECATLCDKTNGCKAFNFTNSEHRCILARNTRDVDTFDSSVYAHKSVVSIICSSNKFWFSGLL